MSSILFFKDAEVLNVLFCYSGEWFCSFCRDLSTPEMEYDIEDKSNTVKEEPGSEALSPIDKRVQMILPLAFLTFLFMFDIQYHLLSSVVLTLFIVDHFRNVSGYCCVSFAMNSARTSKSPSPRR